MRILFFDTETNGLPKGPRGSANPHDWPAIVQLAWQVWEFSDSPRHLYSASYIVRPHPELVWDLGSQGFHRITKDRALSEGDDAAEVLEAFRTALSESSILVAHNLAFDKPVLSAELSRRGFPALAWPTIECCTMVASKNYCRLPSAYSRTDYKFPKLSELHALLFGINTPITFHNAANDVEATVQCFRRLVELEVLPLDVWDFALRVPL
jgi:DNA polymerase-3 subunit alpha/DNA polymerase-3 subunit epsilon